MSIWSEVKCNHFDEIKQKWVVDAWLTGNDGEEGKIIAKVDLNCVVEYIDERAKTDAYAQEIIADVRFDTLVNRVYDLYVKDWCDSRGFDLKDYDYEQGYNGESFVCRDEFINVEFNDKEYMMHLLGGEIGLWLEVTAIKTV